MPPDAIAYGIRPSSQASTSCLVSCVAPVGGVAAAATGVRFCAAWVGAAGGCASEGETPSTRASRPAAIDRNRIVSLLVRRRAAGLTLVPRRQHHPEGAWLNDVCARTYGERVGHPAARGAEVCAQEGDPAFVAEVAPPYLQPPAVMEVDAGAGVPGVVAGQLHLADHAVEP